MYRKYTITKTNVINTYNYLLQAEEISNKQSSLFHQILISSQTLPSLIEHNTIHKIISESENQNNINQIKDRFEFYLQQNLLQIRFKPNLQPISNICKLNIKQILNLINTLSLDLLISAKQVRSLFQHSQKHMNNINKFFSQFIHKNAHSEIVIPFIDQDKIHYYDLFYQQIFCKNKQPEKKIDDRVLRSRLSEKKSKKKIEKEEDFMNSDEIVFQKYINFLLVLLNCSNIVDLVEDIKKISLHTPSKQEFNKRHNKLKNSLSEKTQKGLIQLLYKCINDQNQYNINIFIKECQLILEKHQKVVAKNPTIPTEKNIQCSTTNIAEFKQEKQKNSKSCMLIKKQNSSAAKNENFAPRQSEKKLKTSKSLISLKFTNTSFLPSKNSRSLKKSHGIFYKSKQKFLEKTNVFQNSWATITKQNRNSIHNSNSTINMNSATSNWFNQTVKENQSIIKLRNFKKSNNFSYSASQTPKHNQTNSQVSSTKPIQDEHSHVFDQKYKQQYLGQFIRASLKEQVQIKQDKFTMTDSLLKEIPIQPKNTSNLSFKKQIVKTINFKYYQQFKKQETKETKETKQKEIKQQKPLQKKAEKKIVQRAFRKSQESIQSKTPPKDIKEQLNEKQLKIQKQVRKNTPTQKIKNAKEPVKPKTYQQEQIQEISFSNKKHKPKQKSQLKLNDAKNETNISKPMQINKSILIDKKQQKITAPLLPQNQKTMYIDQFVYILRFLKLNSSKLNLPLKLNNNFMFIINFIYFKSLIQYKNSPTNVYKELINLLTKKQQKFQSHKDECLLYNVQFQSLVKKVKGMESIQASIIKGMNQNSLNQVILSHKQDITVFYVLSCQSNKLLELILNELASYAQTNKFILIQNNMFPLVLQLIYLIILAMIISVQRQTFYRILLQGQYVKLQDCFGFRYSQNAQEYVLKYKKSLENKNIAALNAKEESLVLLNWFNQFK